MNAKEEIVTELEWTVECSIELLRDEIWRMLRSNGVSRNVSKETRGAWRATAGAKQTRPGD